VAFPASLKELKLTGESYLKMRVRPVTLPKQARLIDKAQTYLEYLSACQGRLLAFNTRLLFRLRTWYGQKKT
jgi:hypothetical protein